MNVLLDTKEMDVPIHEVLVAPPKAGQNTRSHFRPLMDSLRIYAVFLKFLVSSLSSYALDIILFTILVPVMRCGLRHLRQPMSRGCFPRRSTTS